MRMTSSRSMPISFESSSGVRWFATSLLSSVHEKARRAQSVDGLVLQLLGGEDGDLHRPRLVRKSLIVLTRYIDRADGGKTRPPGLGHGGGSLRCAGSGCGAA